ncbi:MULTISPECIES: endonuclease/exonuclease/phosphatase family protein [Luteimonas]|uniref:endonuclease/exonuclease/phosphatase family protein n=1 Tax=Luteimonas TaxID=83614 RepID=UPI000C7DF052|nr:MULTISPECIES: endonuclease/exonuclease/phosphatase family protein [Luteimonas]
MTRLTASRTLVALLLGLVLAACAGRAPHRDTAAATTETPVSFVTLNLYHDRDRWPQRLPLILAGLRALDPDVIALQEVLQTGTLPNQAETIGAALGYHVHFVSLDPEGQAHRYGNALLTREAPQSMSQSRLEPAADSRSMGHARLEIRGQPLNVYFTHLHAGQFGGDTRARQVQDVLAVIDRTADAAPVVLLGDFNAAVTTPELAPLAGRYVDAYGVVHPDADATAVTTLNPHYFEIGSRIDLVFVQPGRFDVRDARLVLDTPGADGTWPSDHFGVHVELVPRRTPPD